MLETSNQIDSKISIVCVFNQLQPKQGIKRSSADFISEAISVFK